MDMHIDLLILDHCSIYIDCNTWYINVVPGLLIYPHPSWTDYRNISMVNVWYICSKVNEPYT
jgi:hypothetical protein